MFWNRKNKEENRYYLLPGMGRSNRRQHLLYLKWSVAVGFVVSLAIGIALYFLSGP